MKNNKSFLLSVFLPAIIMLLHSCGSKPSGQDPAKETLNYNILTAQEQEEGFLLLFDGESTNGWRGYNKAEFPTAGWVIENGVLKVEGAGTGEAGGKGGDIIYDRKFKDFHLKLEWKVSEGGNSGVLYLVQEVDGQPIWTTAPEMQLLDNEKHLETYAGLTPLMMAGSLYDMVAATPQNANRAGEWNTAEIIVRDRMITHIQNGEVVVEIEIGSPDWEEKLAGSKFAEYPWFAKYEPGYIALQDHGDNVWFRNIRLKEFQLAENN
jgi:hypothetical protein